MRLRSCITHWPTLVVRYFSAEEQSAPTIAISSAATAANFSMTNRSPPKSDTRRWLIHPCERGWPACNTLSKTIFNGQGCSRPAAPSPITASTPTASAFECGRKRSLIVSGFNLPSLPRPEFPHDVEARGYTDRRSKVHCRATWAAGASWLPQPGNQCGAGESPYSRKRKAA